MAQYRNKTLQKKIGREIKRLRELSGLTQDNYFYDYGIHIGRLETGNVNFTISTMKRICDSFNVSLSEFFAEL